MRYLSFLSLLVLFTACKEDTPVYNLPAQVVTPAGEVIKLPDPEMNNKTLLGVDKNKNGIRDDVEIYIYHNHKDAEEVKYLLLYAKVLNDFFKIKEHEENSRQIKRTEFAINDCGGYNVDFRRWIKIDDAVKEMVFNTIARKKKLKKINKMVGLIKIVSLDRSDCAQLVEELQ